MLASFADRLDKMKIILGSQSPRRRELLSGIFKKFEVIPSEFDESTINKFSFPDPRDFVKVQSQKKAEELANRIGDADIVITADTIVAIDGKILGKPHTHEVAYQMISELNGRPHQVITGVHVVFPKLKKSLSFTETTQVIFDKLPEAAVKAYADSDDPLDKAGAYGIQSGAMSLIKKIDGDYFNVVGLPVNHLAREIYNVLAETA
ncbi:maf protein [Trichomonas vaginalis G3]|uniref:Maf protein n=1 Tax=Trichomonas vaginalis (strain ATCC PRA-98 / G3) TaxID=412133 RepID=A2E4U5_TRIV3|nr:nucleoside-triphosphate diphosphatase protein [Trichomonas vaginalis G3]EAY12284.1 maf protein [Trichomonas vaginalis G3]KAI5552400.1 nucleoside-triphosphate diphosphatase protein [Trichomonas vaginalis G3]|eukprot:XP_001324507.1 maf protein [Trichomonas vaginalis G3]